MPGDDSPRTDETASARRPSHRWSARRSAFGGDEPAPDAPMTADGLYSDADWLRISRITGCAGLRLSGEADMHTAETLRASLAGLPPDALEIHLQLAGLEFIDVIAARHLAALAERSPRPTVILHYPPRSLIFLLHLLWPNSAERFRICGERAAPGRAPSTPGTPPHDRAHLAQRPGPAGTVAAAGCRCRRWRR